MTGDKIKKSIQLSIEYSRDLPKGFQVAAFKEILNFLLNNGDHEFIRPSDNNQNTINLAGGDLPDSHLIKDSSRGVQVLWAVVILNSKNEEANVKTLSELIRCELGVSPPSQKNLSKILHDFTPKYVSREKSKLIRGFCYAPTKFTLSYIKEHLHDEN